MSLSSMNFYCLLIIFFRSMMVRACSCRFRSSCTFYDSRKLFFTTSSRKSLLSCIFIRSLLLIESLIVLI